MLYSIQLCRGLAALLVVLFHSAGNLAKDKYFGASAEYLEKAFGFGGEAGVDFFFVLSGFIIHYIHRQDFDQSKKMGIYLLKRAIRIYPTYFVILLCVYALAMAAPSLRGTMPTDILVLIKTLLLFPQDKSILGGSGAPVIVVAWSLQYEILFYSCFATALLSRRIFYFLIAVFFLNLLFEPIFGPYDFPRSFFANHLIILFGMGMLASVLTKSKFNLPFPAYLAIICALAFVIIALVATYYRATYHKPLIDLTYGSVSAVLIFALARYDLKKASKRPSLFGKLGDSSYALYLIHFPLVAMLSKLAIIVLPKNVVGANVAFLFLVGGSIVSAILFNKFIEKPLLNYLMAKAISHS